MTTERREALRAEAIRWHVLIADATVDDWESFVAWLDADPAHALAYDEVEIADEIAGPAILAAAPAVPIAANHDAPVTIRRWWLRGGVAAAAVLALAIGFGPGMLRHGDPLQVATSAGETRTITLQSGDRIVLNGSSSIVLDRGNPRYAKLEQGEAAFTITHDPAAPFVVDVGARRIQDVGTIFNVSRDSGGLRIAVAEGSVIYDPDGAAVTLRAGQSLSDPGGNGAIRRFDVDPSSVGAWRDGRLSYTAAPLSLVAVDLARATGEAIALDPALADRRFTGTIRIDPNRDRLFTDLAGLLDVSATRGGKGWTLTARKRAAQ